AAGTTSSTRGSTSRRTSCATPAQGEVPAERAAPRLRPAHHPGCAGEATVSPQQWPGGLPVTQVRVARPTDKLDDVVHFYRTDLGLPELDRFSGHAGYEGVMLGLPGTDHHLEVTAGDPTPPRTATTDAE